MTARSADTILAAHARAVAALNSSTEPKAFFQALDGIIKELVGHKLFTLLIAVDDGVFVERVYSSNEPAYPLQGRKKMGPTPWGDRVLKGRQSYLGHNADDIRWAFPDHELIESLGLRSVINFPVVSLGRVFGTINILDVEGHYDEADVAAIAPFVPLLAEPFARLGAA